MTTTARAQAGETVDALCYRVLGRSAGCVEQTYEMNRGLADGGPILAEGQLIALPDLVPDLAPARVQLWD